MSFEDLYDQSVRWIPRRPTLRNFQLVWIHMEYVKAFTNTFTWRHHQSHPGGSLHDGGLRPRPFRFPGSGLIFAMAIFTLIVPPQLIVVPMYLNFRFFNLAGLLGSHSFNLMGTYWPFILLSLTATGFRNGLYIFIMRQFFRGLPKELEEAAVIDGAGMFRTFFSVMLPGSVPG